MTGWNIARPLGGLLAAAVAFAGALTQVLPPPSIDDLRDELDRGLYDRAGRGATHLLEDLRERGEEDTLAFAEAVDVLVESRWQLANYYERDTVPLAERALSIKREILGPGHPGLIPSLVNLGLLRTTKWSKPDPGMARALFDEALGIANARNDSGAVAVGIARIGLGTLDVHSGDRAAGLAQFRQGLEILESSLGPYHPALAFALIRMAGARYADGDLVGAEELYRRALSNLEEAAGPDTLVVTPALDRLSWHLYLAGEYAAARRQFERVLRIKERECGPDHPMVGRTLSSYANLLRVIGDREGATAAYEREVAIAERIASWNPIPLARGALQLAIAGSMNGDNQGALDLVDRAIPILQTAYGPRDPTTLEALSVKAWFLWAAGRGLDSISLRREVVEAREATLGPDHPAVGNDLLRLGNALRVTGDPDGARPLVERALAIYEKSLGPDVWKVANTLVELAQVLVALGEPIEAFELLMRAERIQREVFQSTAATLSERQALDMAASRRAALGRALSLAVRSGADETDAARRVCDAVVRGRALVLDEMAYRNRLVGTVGDSRLAALTSELTAARTALAGLLVRGAGIAEGENPRTAVEGARKRVEQAEGALALASTEYRRRLSRGRVGLDGVAASLPPDGAIVSYVEYSHVGPGAPAPVRSYLAFVLACPEARPVAIPLGEAGRIDAHVREWLDHVSSPPPPVKAAAGSTDQDDLAAGADLRRAVWDPVAAHLKNPRLVFLVPDGALHLVNFAALPVGDGRFLLEAGPILHVLSSERDLAAERGKGEGSGLLALGGADYDAEPGMPGPEAGLTVARKIEDEAAPAPDRPLFRDSPPTCESFATHRFEALPAAAREVDEVAGIWRRRRGRDTRGETSQPHKLLGPRAHETLLKTDAPGRSVLHLATHGFVLGKDCGADAGGSLLLSGLALAGANNRARAGPDEDDGILTAQEVASIDLTAAEWVVLSACDTGRGEVVPHEGVLGLRRAFEVAGADTLIMALWPVDDQSAREWTRALYRSRFDDGLSTAESVHHASLRLLTERRKAGRSVHPFYWGAFVASGDWR